MLIPYTNYTLTNRRRNTKFKVTGVMVNMVSDATKDLNELDFAEDWPQCERSLCVRLHQ